MEQLGKERDFRTRYKSRFKEDARIYADNTYDALHIIVKAVNEARLQNIELRKALQKVEYDGLAGKYEFDETKSLSTGSSSLVCVRNGEARVEK
jgi:branched-chain amino acid transport system substrate-binding protein